MSSYNHQHYLRYKEGYIRRAEKYHREHPEIMALANKNFRKKCRTLIHEIKINGCAICGYDKCDAGLDFHHVNPKDKEFACGVNGLRKHTRTFIDEINKCILFCRNCHAEIHAKERGDLNENLDKRENPHC